MFRGNRGGGGFRGRGNSNRGGGGFRRDNTPMGPPSRIIGKIRASIHCSVAAGCVMHPCEDQIVVACDELEQGQVPYFNGRVFLENKTEIGKIDEILGPLNKLIISVKMNPGVKPESIPNGTRLFIDPAQQLPLDRFLPKPAVKKTGAKAKGPRPAGGSGQGMGRGGSFRGGSRGGNSFRGSNRGGNSFRGRGGRY